MQPQSQPLNARNICAAADDYASVHKFAAFGNWIVPGHVMLGRYPFVEPSRCTTRAIGEAQLEQILGAGITTFVSLQVGPWRKLRAFSLLVVVRCTCCACSAATSSTCSAATSREQLLHALPAHAWPDAAAPISHTAANTPPMLPQAEIPAQEEMTVAGANGFLPYKSTADLIRCTLNG